MVVVTFLVDRIAVMIERCVGGGATTVGSVAGSVDEPGFVTVGREPRQRVNYVLPV